MMTGSRPSLRARVRTSSTSRGRLRPPTHERRSNIRESDVSCVGADINRENRATKVFLFLLLASPAAAGRLGRAVRLFRLTVGSEHMADHATPPPPDSPSAHR